MFYLDDAQNKLKQVTRLHMVEESQMEFEFKPLFLFPEAKSIPQGAGHLLTNVLYGKILCLCIK